MISLGSGSAVPAVWVCSAAVAVRRRALAHSVLVFEGAAAPTQ